ncbi:hypothetical protein CRI93_07895 [Longimonas halophila]|uniref:Dipeptidyl-peptidase n=1 Tax=Longimonas halophila TaxID=1469170 RepID=A0A2H3P7E0_9BACT|nr:S46 family peptidase [Longimonas halophila]PEN07051.1 hypothetical protein CRI93_07895 [Longimonas halophila]
MYARSVGRYSLLSTYAIVAMLIAAMMGGCTPSGEVVSVTERPDSTEGGASAETELPTLPLTAFPAGYDTVRVRPFDLGKMWSIDRVPTSYFQDEYDVAASEEWREHAQYAAVRFSDTCSGGFVSNTGLVVTNHHCAREHITAVEEEGESLGQRGFVASTPGQERTTPNLFIDQLVEVRDVTDEIYEGVRRLRSYVRTERVNDLEERLNEEAKSEDSALRVTVEALYQGARYKAYTYRRYTDVRLVMAPEQQVGFFGGDADNFTYPRYNMDVAFYRAYEDGEPVTPEHYFEWSSTQGSEAGSAVFAVGTPGSTSRLTTVSQVKYERDHGIPNRLAFIEPRIEAMEQFLTNADAGDWPELRNTALSLKNSQKSLQGQLNGIDAYLLARRTANERALQDSIRSVDTLRQHYRGLTRDMEQIQNAKSGVEQRARAFNGFANTQVGSRVLTRAMYGYYIDQLNSSRGVGAQLDAARREADSIADWPVQVERTLIAQRLADVRAAYGPNDPTMQRLFDDKTPEEWAEELASESRLRTQDGAQRLYSQGYRDSDDPSVSLVEAIAPLYFSVVEQLQDFRASEQSINARLNQARLAVFGTEHIAPDAASTLRISDGRVRGYTTDSTEVPAYTTFGGMYERARTKNAAPWDLPERWQAAASDSTLRAAPLNLVSTVDISGGSSGSPLVNADLELVGVVFDSNQPALPNRFLYRTEQARAIAVDSRGIIAALRHVYNAEALVQELVDGYTNVAARP